MRGAKDINQLLLAAIAFVLISVLAAWLVLGSGPHPASGSSAVVDDMLGVFRDPASPVGGNQAGDVSLVECFDYNCPYCRRVAPVMQATEAADPQQRVVYKEFPILTVGLGRSTESREGGSHDLAR